MNIRSETEIEFDRRITEKVNRQNREKGSSVIYESYRLMKGSIAGFNADTYKPAETLPKRLEGKSFHNFRKDTSTHEQAVDALYGVGKSKTGFVFLYGPHDTGKSHLLAALRNGFKDKSEVIYTDWKSFIRKADGDYRISNAYKAIPVLCLDGFLEAVNNRPTKEEIQFTEDVLEYREEHQKATVIATTISLEKIRNMSTTMASQIKEIAKIVDLRDE